MARHNNNLERHVFSDKIKWGLTLIAILLVGVFLAAACTQGFTNGNPWGWFDKKEETEKEQVDAGGGGIAAPVEDGVQAMGLSVTKLAREEYGDYGIMPIADTAFTIKASYTDTSVTYKELDWTIKWKSGASGQWGNGKTVTEYATISPSQDTLTLTITVKQAFGEQIIITATNRLNPECTKSATLDYAKRVTGVTFTFTGKGGTAVVGSSQYKFPSVVDGEKTAKLTAATPTYTYSDIYTVEDTFTVTSLKMYVNTTFVTNLKAAIKGSSLYTGTAKTVIDSIDTTGASVLMARKDILQSTPDLSVFQVLWSELAGDAYTSSTALDSSLKQLLALYMQKGTDHDFTPFFNLYWTVSGTYSSLSNESSPNVFTDSKGFGFDSKAFNTAAAAGSLSFDKSSFIA